MVNFSRQLTKNELAFGLTRLTATENMDTFRAVDSAGSEDITIASGTEVALNNRFQARGIVPDGYWIYKQTGNGNVTAGDTAWTTSQVTLKNHGAASTTVRVLFFVSV